jgi:hypothetical protein
MREIIFLFLEIFFPSLRTFIHTTCPFVVHPAKKHARFLLINKMNWHSSCLVNGAGSGLVVVVHRLARHQGGHIGPCVETLLSPCPYFEHIEAWSPVRD